MITDNLCKTFHAKSNLAKIGDQFVKLDCNLLLLKETHVLGAIMADRGNAKAVQERT